MGSEMCIRDRCGSFSNERLLPCPAGPPSSDPRARGQLVPKGVNDAPESRLLWIPLSVTTRTSRVPRLVRDAEIACAEPTVALAVVHVAPALVVTARCPVPVTPVAVESSAHAASRSCGAAGSRAHLEPWSVESMTPEAVVAKTRNPSGDAAKELGLAAIANCLHVSPSKLDLKTPS